MLPSLALLEQIQQQILNFPNQRKESKRKEHYGLFLLGLKAGLRVSEAINFDLNNRTCQGLYRINKSKGKKERLVYIPKQVISELKQNNWKPNHTNRFNFYHFLRRVKKELNLPANIELTPHTLRRAFATYHAESGLPLPLLQKLLGHASIRTTALYWMNIYGGDSPSDILTGKFWLDINMNQRPKPPQPESTVPVSLNSEDILMRQLPELIIPNPLASEPPPNYLSKIQYLEQQLNQVQAENNNLKNQNTNLQKDLNSLNQQKTNLNQAKNQAISQKEKAQQELTTAQKTIQNLGEKLVATENNLNQEKALLFTQKQINSNLHQQLKTEQTKNQFLQETNANLANQIQTTEQNHTNLLNTYQNLIQKQQITKNQANYYKQQLKSIAKTLYQWQKQNHYQNQEQQKQEQKCQMIQAERPPPWKLK